MSLCIKTFCHLLRQGRPKKNYTFDLPLHYNSKVCQYGLSASDLLKGEANIMFFASERVIQYLHLLTIS